MPDKVSPGPICGNPMPREAVCIHTRKVYDSCREKECLQDIRVYLTRFDQAYLDAAVSVRAKSAELLWAYVEVEPIVFNRGFYTVDVKYFYKITVDVFAGTGRPREISGLATFSKRTVLFGSEGRVRIFSSQYEPGATDVQNFERTNLPIGVVEVVDPVVLGVRIVENAGASDDNCCCCCPPMMMPCHPGMPGMPGMNVDPAAFGFQPAEAAAETTAANSEFPESVSGVFDDVLVTGDQAKMLFVSLGQFSIIKLERDIQLLMPAYDICFPEKECAGTGPDAVQNPCEMFESIQFPVDEFFPRQMHEWDSPAATVVGGPNSTNGNNNNSNNCSCRSCRRR